MNLIGSKVKHKRYGTGVIVEHSAHMITVEFLGKSSKFQYPEAFEKFLIFENCELQNSVEANLENRKTKKQETISNLIYIERAQNDIRSKSIKNVSIENKPSIKLEQGKKRTIGRPMIFLVFQGGTYEQELSGQFIWAPKYTKSGRTCHHWDRLLEVRKDDIILHCADGYIKAISKAIGSCIDAPRPFLLSKEQEWENDGRLVECDYTVLRRPVKHGNYKDVLREYSGVKYAPFDKDGNGNMGYLYDLPTGLSRFFLRELINENKELLNLQYIRELV